MTRERGPIRALVFLGLAIAAGAFSLVTLYNLISSYQAKIDEAKRPEDTVMVLVAARDLYQGVTITEEDLYAVQIPPKFLPEGVFLSPEHVVGRIPRERILANEFVRADRLASPESGVGLNAVIPRGLRAISINVQGGHALAGFLNPGNYVDVLVTIRPDERAGGANAKVQTHTLLQAVFVLGVNSRMQQETADDAKAARGAQRPTVTLLVTADQAEQIAHAENMGEIRLTLRTDLDTTVNQLDGVDIDTLIHRLSAPEVPVRTTVVRRDVRHCHEVKIINGAKSKTILVDATGAPCN